MEKNESTPFYANIKNIPVADLTKPTQTESVTANEQAPSFQKWIIPVAITIVVLQIIGLLVWYSHKERKQAKQEMNQTVAKLHAVEKNGYNVKGFYTQLNDLDLRLSSLPSYVLPFVVHGVKAEVAGVDSKITSQYSTILEKEKKVLTQKLDALYELLQKTKQYEYPSKKEIIAYHQELSDKLKTNGLSIPQIGEYSEELDEKTHEMQKDLYDVLNKEFASLERDYSVAVNFNYPSRERIQHDIEDFGNSTKNGMPDSNTIINYLQKVSTDSKTIAVEVETQKKEIIFANVQNTTSEVNTLLAFFSQRSGYLNEINSLNQYKNTVSTFTRENNKNLTSAALQQKAEKELFSLLNAPRQSKLVAEEKEKAELLARQRQLTKEAGIPVPPLDVPKLIYIDVNKQRMYAYENGISIFDQAVPITTGMAGFDTVRGQYAVYSKYSPFRMRSPFPGIEYDNMVDYVMFFYQGYGIHDASWRSVYGTMDYPSVGSHGCVNTPYNYIQQLYQWAEIGTTVLVV